MKALRLKQYCQPKELQIEEVDKPTPKENEVLVKIKATAVNDYDWSMITGTPRILRLMYGIGKPKIPIPGMEISGIIEAMGSKANAFNIGDAVYGDLSEYGFGGFAEYVCINEKALSLKPENMSFEVAAAIPHASMLALQGLVDVGNIRKGSKVLINGAGGGVGTFGLQLAKLYDAEVTGVDTGGKLSMMVELGFDHIIDYKKEDFTKKGQHYDLILDTKTCRSIPKYARSLTPNGTYSTVGGDMLLILQSVLLRPFYSLFSKKRIRLVMLQTNKDLDYIHELYANGQIKPIIDGPYPFNEIQKAIQRFGECKHTGKVVVTI